MAELKETRIGAPDWLEENGALSRLSFIKPDSRLGKLLKRKEAVDAES